MNMPNNLQHFAMLSLLSIAACNAHADTNSKRCIELKNDVQMEQHYVDDKGQKATRLVPPAKIVPGDEVVYTITATNTCNKPVDNVVINNPVPEHMSYVANSAMGIGTDIGYSLDGKQYATLERLSVKDQNGTTRTAGADDIGAIRWTYANAFQPGASGFVRFRAIVK